MDKRDCGKVWEQGEVDKYMAWYRKNKWIDGFGIEWVPAFLYELRSLGILPESVKIATALLPTETRYIHQLLEEYGNASQS